MGANIKKLNFKKVCNCTHEWVQIMSVHVQYIHVHVYLHIHTHVYLYKC